MKNAAHQLRRRPLRAGSLHTGDALPPLAKLYVLRLLVPGGYANYFIGVDGYADLTLAHALGLASPEDLGEDFDPQAARRKLRDLYQAAEAAAEETPPVEVLESNICALAETAGLSPLAAELLSVTVIIKSLPALGGLNNLIGPIPSSKLHQVLAVMLGAGVNEVREELALAATLHQCGLLRVDRGDSYPIGMKLDLITPEFAERVLSERCEPLQLLRGCVTASPAPELALQDFAHMPLARRLADYLGAAVTAGRRGCNVLIHGKPGIGKTQLSRAAAVAAGLQSFEVAVCGGDQQPIDGDSRLSAYRAAQRLLAKRPVVLIFDEFEDVSDLRIFPGNRGDTISKGSLNELLENNPVPTVFITNAPQDIDAAHLRRFDLVIPAEAPSAERRRELLRASAADYVDAAMLDDIIGHAAATPAVVKRAADVVDMLEQNAATGERRDLFCHVLNGMLQTQSVTPVELDAYRAAADPARLYDASLSNADIDLVELAQAVKGAAEGCRLMLFGPPGTGKTAFGGWLARQIGAPLKIRRASDLLDPYVGKTEQNIARAFAEARQERAVLLIDECDSFIRSRGEAVHRWEHSMTNEFLVQMESHKGTLVLTTNLMDSLDEAMLRRVDFKIRLDHLNADQLRTLLVRYCEAIGLPVPGETCLKRVSQLPCVAPGDFAVVARQARLRRVATPEDFVERLAAETAFKRSRKTGRQIGFLMA